MNLRTLSKLSGVTLLCGIFVVASFSQDSSALLRDGNFEVAQSGHIGVLSKTDCRQILFLNIYVRKRSVSDEMIKGYTKRIKDIHQKEKCLVAIFFVDKKTAKEFPSIEDETRTLKSIRALYQFSNEKEISETFKFFAKGATIAEYERFFSLT